MVWMDATPPAVLEQWIAFTIVSNEEQKPDPLEHLQGIAKSWLPR